MTLPKNVYTALEDIVGKENISDDPAVLDSYRDSLAHTAIHLSLGGKEVGGRHGEVELPGTRTRWQDDS